jgi:hypothetical protein
MRVEVSAEYGRPMRTIDARRRRLAIARAATRLELGLGALAIPLVLFVLVAAPRYHGLPGSPPPNGVIEMIGVVGVVIGFVWMLRMRLADPEAGAPPWRYRSDADRQ